MFRTQESNEELPLLTGFIQESQQISNNGFNRDQKQSLQEQHSKLRHRSVLQTSDPLQLQLLREALERKKSPEPVFSPNNRLKNQIQFSSLQNHGLHRAQQLQAEGGMMLKQKPDLLFNGHNSQQQNVLIQNNNPLVQIMKTGVSSQASLINNPRTAHNLKAPFDGSRFNTDSDTDFEGYMSAAGGWGRAPSVIKKNFQMARLQQQDSISSNNGLKLPISKSMQQMKNLPTLSLAGSQKQHHMNQMSQQQQQMEIDKTRLLQLIDQLVQKKRIARELQILEDSNYLQKLQQFQEKSNSNPLNIEIHNNQERNEVPSQPLIQVYDHDNQLYNAQTASDYQSQIGSSYPLYLLEQNNLNSHLGAQSVYLPKTYSRNHFQGVGASASIQQMQRGANLYQTEIFQPNYINMHPQILLEDGGSIQHDENFSLYQQQAIQEQLLRNGKQNHQYLTLQNLPQHLINKQEDKRTHKAHHILGSVSQKQKRQSFINEEISEREEIEFEFAQQEKEDTPNANRFSKFKPDSQYESNKATGIIIDRHIIDDMNISPIDSEHRPSLKDPKSFLQKGELIRNSSQNQGPLTQQYNRSTSTRREGNVGTNSNLQIQAQNKIEDHKNNIKRRNTVDSTSTDDRDIRLLKDQINEGLKRSAEFKMASLKQIKIPIFDDHISTAKNKYKGGEQNQTSNSRIESSHAPIKVVIVQDQDIVLTNKNNINMQSQQQAISKQQIFEEMKSLPGQQDQINQETLDQGASKETLDIIHNTSPKIFKNQQIRNSPLPVAVNQLLDNYEENKERKQIQPKNSNSSTVLAIPNNPLLQFKDSSHRGSDMSSAKTQRQILNENEAKELVDIEKLLKNVDGEESTQNKKLPYGLPAVTKNKLPGNNQAKNLSKKSSIKNPKYDNQLYESFSEKFNSSSIVSLHNNIIAKSRENFQQSLQASPVAQHLVPARDSIQIEMSVNPKLLETGSDTTPLQKSPQSKSEVRTNNDSPEIIHSLLNRGSISIVSNVMSLNIVREDPIARMPSQHSNRSGSSQIKIEEQQKKSSGKIEITRMPYGMLKKVKDSQEIVQKRRKSRFEDQSRLRANISENPFQDNNEMTQDRDQLMKPSNQQMSKHEDFPMPTNQNHHHQPKTLIVLKNNINVPETITQISENIPLPAPQPVTTITVLAPTIDAILDPTIQEIVQTNTAPPPQEKIFKKGRNARGKGMFAQNILFKLAKPRKHLDPEEIEKMLQEKEKEDKDNELEELKAQSQTIPKPPKGKRRYVDYLIKQNETTRPESSQAQVVPQAKRSAQKLVSSNEIKKTTFASQFSFRLKKAISIRKSLESNQNFKEESKEITKQSDFNIKLEPLTDPIPINQSQNDFNTDVEETPYLRNASRTLPNYDPEIFIEQQHQVPYQVKQQTGAILSSSLNREITNKPSSFLKKKQTVKFQTPEQQEIAIPQQLKQIIAPEIQAQDINMTFTTLAIAKAPEVRQNYEARPKKPDERLAITPREKIGQSLGPNQDNQNANAVPQSRLSDKISSNFAPNTQMREQEKKLSALEPKPRESNSNLTQLGQIEKSMPNVSKKSGNKVAPPELKHSNIDIQIIQTTLQTPSAINKEKQSSKMSSNNIQDLNFNKVTRDQTDPPKIGTENLERDQKSRNYQSLGTFNQELTSQRTANGSSKQLIMPKSRSSSNFLMTQQSLYQEPHLKQHPEGPTLSKKSNKVLPKVSTNSISSIGRFMRGGPNRKVSSGGEFTIGVMHGKNF